jgi:hypothetical protein
VVEVLTVLPAELVVMKRYQLWAAVGCGVSISRVLLQARAVIDERSVSLLSDEAEVSALLGDRRLRLQVDVRLHGWIESSFEA